MLNNFEELYDLALIVANVAHRGQYDKHGLPYVEHPMRVCGNVRSEEAKVIALLHDVIEDTPITADDLRPYFGEEIVSRLLLLTKAKGEDYIETYIARISTDPIAIEVKLGDLKDNMDPRRVLNDSKKETRMAKYRKAKLILQAAA